MNSQLYMATVLPGLETTAIHEMTCKLKEIEMIDMARGQIFFKTALSVDKLFYLRCVDNLYYFIARFPVGRHKSDLRRLEENMAALDLRFVESISPLNGGYFVNASRRGKHSYSRFQAADASMNGIAKICPQWPKGNPAKHSVEFRLDIAEENALFYLRLTEPAFRFRGRNRLFSRAALTPTVAHALVWLSAPEPEDIFIDPCCGSGTILSERRLYPYKKVFGGDIAEEAVVTAQYNLKSISNIQIRQWDAGNLPFDTGYADKIVTNLPFGRQIGSTECLGELYKNILKEFSRVLKENGKAVVLCEDAQLLYQAAQQASLECKELSRLSLKGILPAVFEMYPCGN